MFSRLKFALRPTATTNIPLTAKLSETQMPCVNCGGREAYVIETDVTPDFDPGLLDRPLRQAFLTKQNGYCTTCGIFQDFNRLTAEHIRAVNALGKDILTTDPGFHSYPPPVEVVEQFNKAHFEKRLQKWRAYFDERQITIGSALFIRIWFGAAAAFVSQRFGARIAGLDMSETCLRYTQDHLSTFKPLEGYIDGMFEGPFLETGPYDAVFIFHVLTHSCDACDTLRKIKGLLKPGGFAVFTNEVERKPQNPFHNIHLSEWQLLALLRNEFDRVDRVDECEDGYVPHASPYTVKGDIPDFVAWS